MTIEQAAGASTLRQAQEPGEVAEPHVAHNYHPLPVMIARGEGA